MSLFFDELFISPEVSNSLEIPLPGYKKEEVEVKVSGRYLFVKAENKRYGKKTGKYLISYSDTNNMKCSLEDGILSIKFGEDKKIPVE